MVGPGARSRLEEELDLLSQELARAVGLRGRDRSFSSPVERARISVTKAIRTAIRLIGKHCPDLAAHLDASIQTGRFCSYAPLHPAGPSDASVRRPCRPSSGRECARNDRSASIHAYRLRPSTKESL